MKKPDPGIFLVKGDRVSVPKLTVSVDENGSIKVDPVDLYVGIDMAPYWLNIAYKHLNAAERSHLKLMEAKKIENDMEIGKYLKQESSSCMQCIMASCIAVDAYYALIKEIVNLPRSTIDAWKKSGTARYKQISETLRIAFYLPQKSSKSLRDIIKQNFDFRDKAVHPSPGTKPAAIHVELNKATDWRYATFRYYNAKAIYGLSLSMVYQLSSKRSSKVKKELSKFCESLEKKLKPLLKRWERKHGKLF